MFSSARIAVTGSAGFIGSHLCEALLGRGATVVGIDNMDPYYPVQLKRANLARITDGPGADRFTQHEMDICDTEALTRVFKEAGIEGVIHLAAKAGVRPSIADPVAYARVNVVGTQSVLTAAHQAECERAVCASSSSVYGNNTKVPFGEDDPVEHPISPYAATKLGCELIGRTHHHLTGMPTAMLRFFTVFGPRQRPDLAINLFLSKISRGETIDRYGDGTTSRDYTYINDIINGVLSAYNHIHIHGFRVWNLGGDHPTTLNELISAVETVVDRKAVINEMGMQPGDVERTWADLTRSGAELGYAPTTAILEGVAQQWAWMQQTNQPDAGEPTP